MSRYPVNIFVSQQAECMILPLWRQGQNTNEISKALAIPEFEVANRLFRLREQHGGSNVTAHMV